MTRGLDPDVDVVASGHTHEAYVCRIDGTVVTSAAPSRAPRPSRTASSASCRRRSAGRRSRAWPRTRSAPLRERRGRSSTSAASAASAFDQQEAGGRLVAAGLPDDLDPVFSYAVAMRGFLAAGGDGFTVFREAMTERVVGTDVDVLAAYLAAG